MRIAIIGHEGRMGRALREVCEIRGHQWVGVDPKSSDGPVTIEELGESVDVVVDFSSAAGTEKAARWCEEHGVPLVTGTTALHEGALRAIESSSRRVPVVKAANFSPGINLLLSLVRTAARALEEYDIEIVEIHHSRKKDAPSGTALELARAAADARGWDEGVIHAGQPAGERPRERIGVQALRGGDVKGEHTVFVIGDTERIELTHRAYDRRVFAQGAILAAEWVKGRKPGLYSMADVLGMNMSNDGNG